MARSLKVYIIAMIAILLFMMLLSFAGITVQHESMLIGMGLGISASPIMMYVVKKWINKRKVDKMLKELYDIMNARKEQEKTEKGSFSSNSM